MHKVAVLLPSLGRAGGGLVSSVGNYLAHFYDEALQVRVFGENRDIESAATDAWRNVEVEDVRWVGIGPFVIQPQLGRRLKSFRPNLIHLNGLWNWQSISTGFYTKKQLPILVSVHGMLDQWALRNSATKKKIGFALFQRNVLNKASCIHALCENELESIRSLGFRNPIALISNGVPASGDCNLGIPVPALRYKTPPNKKILLYLGRLHPKKGIEELIIAWSQFVMHECNNDTWCLVIAGEGEKKYQKRLEHEITSRNVKDSVLLVGGQYGNYRHACFQSASAFILPSHSEGVPMAVLEAWNNCLPTIISSQCNLSEGIRIGAAMLIEPTVSSILTGLIELSTKGDQDLEEMGKTAFVHVQSNHGAESLSKKLAQLYRWLLGAESRPCFVDVCAGTY